MAGLRRAPLSGVASVSKYTWVVTRDAVLGDSSDAVGRIGPPGAKDRARFDVVIIRGEHFRMLDDSGQVRYIGYILGEYSGREPLEEYGVENGCTVIEYERDGRWTAV